MAKKLPPYLLDMRSREYGYRKGWIDRDELILIACFTILKNFVEKEDPFKYHFRKDGKKPKRSDYATALEYRQMCKVRAVGKEIWTLYTWWVELRGKQQAELEQKLNKIGDKVYARSSSLTQAVMFSIAMYEQDQKMLHRLMEIRPNLWT